MQIRHIRQVQQAHAGLFRQTTALAAIASAAGGDAVHPTVQATARRRVDMFAGQVIRMRTVAAVGAHIAITHEQLRVGEGRCLAPSPAGHSTTHRNDGVHFNAGLRAGAALPATAQDMAGVAQSPGNAVAGIDHRCFASRDPSLRPTRDIQLKHVHCSPPSLKRTSIVRANPMGGDHVGACSVRSPLQAAARPKQTSSNGHFCFEQRRGLKSPRGGRSVGCKPAVAAYFWFRLTACSPPCCPMAKP